MAEWCHRQGIPFFTYTKGFSANPLVGWRIKSLCRQLGIDLIHAHDSHSHTFACLAAALGNPTPVVISRRVDFPISRSAFSRWKYNHPRVVKILCVSAAIQRIMARDIQRPERLEVVYSGIDSARFNLPASGILRREFNIPAGAPIVANVAAIAPHKDYFTFVRTAERLVRQGLDARFLIIGGDGGEEKAIRALVTEKGLSENILFTGFRTDIPAILPEIDIFLFTSKTEGLGTSLLDAFSCRAPVVATAAGGAAELVIPHHTGLLAPVGDDAALAEGVQELLVNPALRKTLAENAHALSREFSMEKMAEKTWKAYQSILNP